MTIPEPMSLPGGWGAALARLMGQMPSQGWETIHQWAGPPVEPAVVREALGRHPDLDPEILLFYSMMDGLELIFGKPVAPRHEYETIVQVRRAASKDGGRLGCIDELWSHSTIGTPYVEEFSEQRGGEVRMLEIPSLERLLDQSEDFAHRDEHNVIFGRIVLENGEYFGIVRSDEIRRWRQPSAGQRSRKGYYDAHARSYQERLNERERERPGPWWVVRGEDHGAVLSEPGALLRWSEMLTMCLRHLETGST